MSTQQKTSSSTTTAKIIELAQSLLVAFSFALIFQGFVIQSFVIPTGSMAPTLLGQHWLIESSQTGTSTTVGLGETRPDTSRLRDWQISRNHRIEPQQGLRTRMGDRIVVVKSLYPFFMPDRFDVAVFKNPTIPYGPSANYIKRIVGLPGESIWLVDGDVFIQKDGDDRFHVARKSRHVQNSVWQQVHDTQSEPVAPDKLGRRWKGSPWIGEPDADWSGGGHAGFRCDTANPSTLTWDTSQPGPDDWTAYNMLSPELRPRYSVSDIRIDATLVPDDSSLEASLMMEVRSHRYRFHVDGTSAGVSMWPVAEPDRILEVVEPFDGLQAGGPLRLECIHSDQRLSLRINGVQIAELEYDWTPDARRVRSMGGASKQADGTPAATLAHRLPSKPKIWWSFEGSPLSIPRIRMDRDLYYRPTMLQRMSRVWNEPAEEHREAVRLNKPAAGTHPDTVITLKDDQYFVLGDNSGRSLDGRLWGAPHPYVANQIDDSPFIVPGDLLIGKAWMVYYPAPHSPKEGGMGLIPDFGSLRFIQ